jgi:hypothetical protein
MALPETIDSPSGQGSIAFALLLKEATSDGIAVQIVAAAWKVWRFHKWTKQQERNDRWKKRPRRKFSSVLAGRPVRLGPLWLGHLGLFTG